MVAGLAGPLAAQGAKKAGAAKPAPKAVKAPAAAPKAQKPAPAQAPKAGGASVVSTKGRTPDQVAKAYLDAQARKDEKAAWGLLSASSRKAKGLSDWAKQAETVRSSFPVILPVIGEAILVGGVPTKQTSLAKATVTGDIAKVDVRQLVQVPTSIVMVKENGEWRVDAARSVSGDTSPAKPQPKPTTPPTGSTPTSPTSPTSPVTPAKVDTAPQCRTRMRELATAFQVYALNHDGTLPKADTWQTDLAPFVKDPTTAFKCPGDAAAKSSTYAMNRDLSGMKLADIANGGDVVLLFESSKDGTNQSGAAADVAKPARHDSGNVYAFADGTQDVRQDVPSFAPQTVK
jgi:hypothetical protein